MNDLVTIIIPIYNTEKYLERAIHSVLKQTYRKIEILLIDDGSTDKSPEICDAYKNMYSQIQVIHQKNSGQGAARNKGLDICKGKYVVFLDSDDFMYTDFISNALDIINRTDADIYISQFEYYDESDNVVKKKKVSQKIYEYSGIDAAKDMLYWKHFGVAPWAKVYKKSLWDCFRFPEDRIYEDLAVTYKVALYSQKVVFEDKVYWGYRIRDNSDVHSEFSIKKMKMLDTVSEILCFAQNSNTQLIKAAQSRCLSAACFLLFQMPFEDDKLKKERDTCWNIIACHRKNVICDNQSKFKTRVGALLSYAGRDNMKKIYMLYKKKV